MSRWRESSGLSFGSQIVPPGESSCGNACASRTRFSKSHTSRRAARAPRARTGSRRRRRRPCACRRSCTVRSGFRACRSNSAGAFATCSRIQSGSSFTSSPSTFCPACSKYVERLGVQELDPELADDPAPAALELRQRELVEDLVPRHVVDQHASSWRSMSRSSACSRPASPVSRTSSGSPSVAAARSACARSAGGRLLREPDDLRVVAEVVVAELRVTVEPEPADDDAVEAADEEVGEEVRAGLVLRAVHLVAVRAVEPRVARRGRRRSARTRRRPRRRGGRLDRGADALGPVVQLRRHRPHLDVPAATGGDLLHVHRQRATRDDDRSSCGERELGR